MGEDSPGADSTYLHSSKLSVCLRDIGNILRVKNCVATLFQPCISSVKSSLNSQIEKFNISEIKSIDSKSRTMCGNRLAVNG